MRIVKIKDFEIIVDDEDERLVENLCVNRARTGCLIVKSKEGKKYKTTTLGRFILSRYKGIPSYLDVCYENGNRCDVTKANLRIRTRSENLQHAKRRPRKNTCASSFTRGLPYGVYSKKGKFEALIRISGRLTYLGRFDTPLEAKMVVQDKLKALGEIK